MRKWTLMLAMLVVGCALGRSPGESTVAQARSGVIVRLPLTREPR